MGLSRPGRPVSGGKLVMAAVSAVGIGVLAGCTGSSSSTGSSATPGTTATASGHRATAPAASATAPSKTIAFVPITEPFDPGHPARATQGGGDCAREQTTLAMTRCYEDNAENQDAVNDAAQRARFATATPAKQAAMNAADQAWLAARGPVCTKAFHTGGTIDQVNIARCLADESLARFFVVKNFETPTGVLKLNSPDSHNPVDTPWFSAPDGSRIMAVNTQGDGAGGVIIAWTVIAGANGFTVNPLNYYYRNGFFRDSGIMEQPDQAGHTVAPGSEYAFRVDYSNLAHDPYRAVAPGQFDYAPAGELAVWW